MMSEFEPYSMRRKRAARAGHPVVYTYDNIPGQLRAQVFHAIERAGGGQYINGKTNAFWVRVERVVVKEHGYFERLPARTRNQRYHGSYDRIIDYLESLEDVDRFLDVVELGIRTAQLPLLPNLGKPWLSQQNEEKRVQQAVDELNQRFGQHDLGYAFVGVPGTIVRVDTQYVHEEVIVPAIAQLSALGWEGPLEEFLQAHRHYRRRENKAAMNEALKAFESTMKAILHAHEWDFEETWQASKLIQALMDKGLLPSALESYFGGIRSVLSSGVPTLRNRLSGHGQGTTVSEVPSYVAAFALNLTASNIVFLVSAHEHHGLNGVTDD